MKNRTAQAHLFVAWAADDPLAPHDAPRMPEGRRPRRCLDNRSKSVFVIASQLFCHFEHQFMPALITTARAAEWRTVHGAARAESKRSFRSGRVKRPRGKA